MRFGNPPQLRGVKKADLPRIAELDAIAFHAGSLTRSALDVMYDPSGALWVLAEDSTGIWGHSVNARGEDPRVGWIVGMAVHPMRQRRGWGRALLAGSIERLCAADIDVIRLLVKPTNKVARRMYETFGFMDTGARVDHFGTGEDRVVMSLLLPNPQPHVHGVRMPQIPVSPDYV